MVDAKAPEFPTLLSPLNVGPLRVRNRVVSTGHMTGMLRDGVPTEQFVAYHRARARGGCGLIITESAAVHPTSNYYNIQLFRDEVLQRLEQTANAVHEAGAALFGQLGHGGRETHTGSDGSAPVALAPSALAGERFHVMPRALSSRQIADIVTAFGAAARRYQLAGYDGVEIMASHGLLAAQFLNPASNQRSDAYGGSRRNRLRFVREVIDCIREQVGRSLVLGVRISGDELTPAGLDAHEAIAVCGELSADGTLDFLDICGGSMSALGASVHVVPPMNLAPGYLAPLSARIRAQVDVPVLVAGRINDPRLAESILKQGQADLCGMTRAQICDPDLVEKLVAARIDDVRACIGCNQACIGHMQAGHAISCIQFPESGRELLYATALHTDPARRVVVIGGGPGGMKAAAASAARGHHVTLFEASGELGGQVRLARSLPGRDEFGGLVENLRREMDRHQVNVQLGQCMDAAAINALAPDCVVLATGATPWLPENVEINGAHWVHAVHVLEGANVGARVVIIDSTTNWVALGIAEQLARNGCHVRIAVNGYMAGQAVQQYTRDRWLGELHGLGVEVIPLVRLAGADEDTVYLQHTVSGQAVILEDVDSVVAATGMNANCKLERELLDSDYDNELWVIGDAMNPRSCEEAVLEGLKCASAIGTEVPREHRVLCLRAAATISC